MSLPIFPLNTVLFPGEPLPLRVFEDRYLRMLRDRVANRQRVATQPILESAVAGQTVALFPGCMTDRIYPEQGEAVVTVLEALGVTVRFPEGLHCCGLIPNNSGDTGHARTMAIHTVERLEATTAGDRFQWEIKRRERVVESLETLRKHAAARRVQFPAPPDARNRLLANLPLDIAVEAGELRIRFGSAEDLAAKLFELSQAMANDWAAFETAFGSVH